MKVEFDGGLLGTPDVTLGDIIPVESDATPVGASGLADVAFDSSVLFGNSGFPITNNGTFFTFDVTASGSGSGTLAITSINAISDFSSGTFFLVAAPPEDVATYSATSTLSFTVQDTSPVPEPSSLALLGAGIAGLSGCSLVSRRRRRRLRND